MCSPNTHTGGVESCDTHIVPNLLLRRAIERAPSVHNTRKPPNKVAPANMSSLIPAFAPMNSTRLYSRPVEFTIEQQTYSSLKFCTVQRQSKVHGHASQIKSYQTHVLAQVPCVCTCTSFLIHWASAAAPPSKLASLFFDRAYAHQRISDAHMAIQVALQLYARVHQNLCMTTLGKIFLTTLGKIFLCEARAVFLSVPFCTPSHTHTHLHINFSSLFLT